MKRLFFLIFMLTASATSCSEDDSGPQIGCSTGIPVAGGDRTLLRCCTREEHNAGNNVGAGGVSYWNSYTDHQWESAKDCQQCQDKWW